MISYISALAMIGSAFSNHVKAIKALLRHEVIRSFCAHDLVPLLRDGHHTLLDGAGVARSGRIRKAPVCIMETSR